MIVRPWKRSEASEVELAAVVACLRTSFTHREPPERLSAVRARALFEEWLAVPKTAVLTGRLPGKEPDAVAVIRKEPPALRVVYLGVRTPRNGFGSRMLEAVRAIARRQPDLSEIRASIRPTDPAHEGFFLRRHGFEPAVDGEAAGAGAGGEDALEVVLRL